MTLRELRKEKELNQKEAASIANVSLRTYIYYENDPNKVDTNTYKHLYNSLYHYKYVDEEHGILDIETITKIVVPILKKHNISYCYIFGSYAKGNPRENSDVDLLVDTDITGLAFFGLIEELRVALKKKVDLLPINVIQPNNPISLDILKYGKRIL